ncbi:hypothetical protein OUZ56_027651 [Daphnia magna]|uniref:NADH:ubiquinone oxidoreductase intermediate-associated protein 30 domain-containing protein n=1 Tax=Daphnia magna TaxID=35525 RepID=A0ABR0B1J0_9CRUS|nr:hypothetical protein OUZ56_027651 [Daphnia magna]
MIANIGLKVAGAILIGSLASYHSSAACLATPSSVSGRQTDVAMGEDVMLFNFTDPNANISTWVESSDTVRQPGMSKASIVLQKAQLFQRAIFFALLNPQPNGAGFAGVRTPVDFDLSSFSTLKMKLRGQGQATNFKIIIKHHGEVGDGSPSYEQFFTATNEFQELSLPIDKFQPYWRGQALQNAEPLDSSNITSFGFQFYGGVYEEHKQSGPATLEIDWVKASI